MKKLNSILLIDDNEHDNFYHELILNEANCTSHILSMQKASDALDYLSIKKRNSSPEPELIFIDINMPEMDGFEFLEEYNKRNKDQKNKPIIIMLTTSLNPEDRKRADCLDEISMFGIKPLNKEMLNSILDNYFPDYLSVKISELPE